MTRKNIKNPQTLKSIGPFFLLLIFRASPEYALEVVFNHDQTDYIEEIQIDGNLWDIPNVLVDFKKQSRMENITACLSSTNPYLFNFPKSDQKCSEIIHSICKDEKCKEEDVNKAPEIVVKFDTFEFKFFGKEYLYTQGKDKDLKIFCRFGLPNKNEKCNENSLVLGKPFYNKYVPVIRVQKENISENGFGAESKMSIAWLPYFDNYKHKNGLKWAMIGISIAIVISLILIFVIQKFKKITPEDYHEIQA